MIVGDPANRLGWWRTSACALVLVAGAGPACGSEPVTDPVRATTCAELVDAGRATAEEVLDQLADRTLADMEADHPSQPFADLDPVLRRDVFDARAAALGCAVQANGYYLRFFGDQYVAEGLGTERASQMTRVGSARRNGMSVALHSDLPMGPLEPLLAASAMATRTSGSGVVLGENERLSPYDAIAAVTIEPAWQLFLDGEIGSLAAGKLADVTVLADDPFEMEPATWPDIDIEATMLSGRVYPLPA